MARKYSSTSVDTTIVSTALSAGGTTVTVANAANLTNGMGYTTNDTFIVAIGPDTASEEICIVTAVSSNTLTITRAQGGTSATSHAIGTIIRHVLTSIELTDFETVKTNHLDKTTINAKGDLLPGSANDTYARLAAGANETRLVADSTETTGLKYVADTTNYAIAAKGDLLAGTAADTLQAVTVGANGTTLVANSAATPGISWSGAQIAKNILINGDCVINERGSTTETLTTAAKFAADRFFVRRTSGSSGAQSEYLTSTSLDAFPRAIRIQRTSGNSATDTLVLGQTVETLNARPLQGKTVTFSFWARKGANYTAASDALLVRVFTGTGTDQTGLGSGYTGTATPISQSATLTTSWQRFSFSATIATTATQLQATVQYTPVGTASTNDYFDATGFQLEVGSVATPFVLAGGGQYSAELDLCRRYYERWTSLTAYMRIGSGYATSGTQAKITIQFKTPKRVGPTSSQNFSTGLLDSSNDTVYTMTSYSLIEENKESITQTMNATSASFTAGEYIELVTNNVIGAYQAWTSEIG